MNPEITREIFSVKLILENTQGNLTLLKDKDWLALTRKADLDKKDSGLLFTGQHIETYS